MKHIAITCKSNGQTFWGTNIVESCIQPFVDRWETTDANAVATDYEEADKIIDWMNRKKPVVIVADGRFWKLDNPHFVATVLRSWEVE